MILLENTLIIPGESKWLILNLSTLIAICLMLISSWTVKKNYSFYVNTMRIGIGVFFTLKFLFIHSYNILDNSWSPETHIPLHLCNLMWLVAIYMMFTKKKWAFEMLLFIGMPSGFYSMLTPELTHGDGLVREIDFFIGHGGLILAPLYAIIGLDMWPRKNAWWKSFLRLQIFLFIVGPANYLLRDVLNYVNTNYMYLCTPPSANNPLIPREGFWGQWPWYILIFEFLIILHTLIINTPFWFINKVKKNQICEFN